MKLPSWHYDWLKERDEVVKTYDVNKFKVFYIKWKMMGLYSLPLPSDDVIEVSMRKMVYNMLSSTESEKDEAKKWLIEHGSTTEM